jgi:hypothetical protein
MEICKKVMRGLYRHDGGIMNNNNKFEMIEFVITHGRR